MEDGGYGTSGGLYAPWRVVVWNLPFAELPGELQRACFPLRRLQRGWYASRNAAFQNAVSKASGVKLALDGDLIRYNSKEPGKTELAVRKLAGQLGMSEREIRSQLEKGDSLAFEKNGALQESL